MNNKFFICCGYNFVKSPLSVWFEDVLLTGYIKNEKFLEIRVKKCEIFKGRPLLVDSEFSLSVENKHVGAFLNNEVVDFDCQASVCPRFFLVRIRLKRWLRMPSLSTKNSDCTCQKISQNARHAYNDPQNAYNKQSTDHSRNSIKITTENYKNVSDYHTNDHSRGSKINTEDSNLNKNDTVYTETKNDHFDEKRPLHCDFCDSKKRPKFRIDSIQTSSRNTCSQILIRIDLSRYILPDFLFVRASNLSFYMKKPKCLLVIPKFEIVGGLFIDYVYLNLRFDRTHSAYNLGHLNDFLLNRIVEVEFLRVVSKDPFLMSLYDGLKLILSPGEKNNGFDGNTPPEIPAYYNKKKMNVPDTGDQATNTPTTYSAGNYVDDHNTSHIPDVPFNDTNSAEYTPNTSYITGFLPTLPVITIHSACQNKVALTVTLPNLLPPVFSKNLSFKTQNYNFSYKVNDSLSRNGLFSCSVSNHHLFIDIFCSFDFCFDDVYTVFLDIPILKNVFGLGIVSFDRWFRVCLNKDWVFFLDHLNEHPMLIPPRKKNNSKSLYNSNNGNDLRSSQHSANKNIYMSKEQNNRTSDPERNNSQPNIKTPARHDTPPDLFELSVKRPSHLISIDFYESKKPRSIHFQTVYDFNNPIRSFSGVIVNVKCFCYKIKTEKFFLDSTIEQTSLFIDVFGRVSGSLNVQHSIEFFDQFFYFSQTYYLIKEMKNLFSKSNTSQTTNRTSDNVPSNGANPRFQSSRNTGLPTKRIFSEPNLGRFSNEDRKIRPLPLLLHHILGVFTMNGLINDMNIPFYLYNLGFDVPFILKKGSDVLNICEVFSSSNDYDSYRDFHYLSSVSPIPLSTFYNVKKNADFGKDLKCDVKALPSFQHDSLLDGYLNSEFLHFKAAQAISPLTNEFGPLSIDNDVITSESANFPTNTHLNIPLNISSDNILSNAQYNMTNNDKLPHETNPTSSIKTSHPKSFLDAITVYLSEISREAVYFTIESQKPPRMVGGFVLKCNFPENYFGVFLEADSNFKLFTDEMRYVVLFDSDVMLFLDGFFNISVRNSYSFSLLDFVEMFLRIAHGLIDSIDKLNAMDCADCINFKNNEHVFVNRNTDSSGCLYKKHICSNRNTEPSVLPFVLPKSFERARGSPLELALFLGLGIYRTLATQDAGLISDKSVILDKIESSFVDLVATAKTFEEVRTILSKNVSGEGLSNEALDSEIPIVIGETSVNLGFIDRSFDEDIQICANCEYTKQVKRIDDNAVDSPSSAVSPGIFRDSRLFTPTTCDQNSGRLHNSTTGTQNAQTLTNNIPNIQQDFSYSAANNHYCSINSDALPHLVRVNAFVERSNMRSAPRQVVKRRSCLTKLIKEISTQDTIRMVTMRNNQVYIQSPMENTQNGSSSRVQVQSGKVADDDSISSKDATDAEMKNNFKNDVSIHYEDETRCKSSRPTTSNRLSCSSSDGQSSPSLSIDLYRRKISRRDSGYSSRSASPDLGFQTSNNPYTPRVSVKEATCAKHQDKSGTSADAQKALKVVSCKSEDNGNQTATHGKFVHRMSITNAVVNNNKIKEGALDSPYYYKPTDQDNTVTNGYFQNNDTVAYQSNKAYGSAESLVDSAIGSSVGSPTESPPNTPVDVIIDNPIDKFMHSGSLGGPSNFPTPGSTCAHTGTQFDNDSVHPVADLNADDSKDIMDADYEIRYMPDFTHSRPILLGAPLSVTNQLLICRNCKNEYRINEKQAQMRYLRITQGHITTQTINTNPDTSNRNSTIDSKAINNLGICSPLYKGLSLYIPKIIITAIANNIPIFKLETTHTQLTFSKKEHQTTTKDFFINIRYLNILEPITLITEMYTIEGKLTTSFKVDYNIDEINNHLFKSKNKKIIQILSEIGSKLYQNITFINVLKNLFKFHLGYGNDDFENDGAPELMINEIKQYKRKINDSILTIDFNLHLKSITHILKLLNQTDLIKTKRKIRTLVNIEDFNILTVHDQNKYDIKSAFDSEVERIPIIRNEHIYHKYISDETNKQNIYLIKDINDHQMLISGVSYSAFFEDKFFMKNLLEAYYNWMQRYTLIIIDPDCSLLGNNTLKIGITHLQTFENIKSMENNPKSDLTRPNIVQSGCQSAYQGGIYQHHTYNSLNTFHYLENQIYSSQKLDQQCLLQFRAKVVIQSKDQIFNDNSKISMINIIPIQKSRSKEQKPFFKADITKTQIEIILNIQLKINIPRIIVGIKNKYNHFQLEITQMMEKNSIKLTGRFFHDTPNPGIIGYVVMNDSMLLCTQVVDEITFLGVGWKGYMQQTFFHSVLYVIKKICCCDGDPIMRIEKKLADAEELEILYPSKK